MSWQQTIKQELWLLRLLAAPGKVMCWILWLGLICVLPGLVLLWWAQMPLLLVFGLILWGGYLASIQAFLPLYFFQLGSKKTLLLVTHLRLRLLRLMVLLLAFSALVIGYGFFRNTGLDHGLYAWLAFVSLSLYMQVLVVAASYSPRLIALLPVLMVALLMGGVKLLASHLWLSAGLALVGWVVFALWWLKSPGARPMATGLNLELISIRPAAPYAPTANWRWLQGPGKSLVGSLLQGASDGLRAETLRQGFVLLILAASVGFLLYARATGVHEGFLGGGLMIFSSLLLLGGGLEASQKIFANLQRLWLYFPGDRMALLGYIERWYLRRLGLALAICLAVYLVVLALGYINLAYALHDLKLLALITAAFGLHFLLSLWLYLSTSASFQVFTGVNFFVILVMVLIFAMANEVIAQSWYWLLALVVFAGLLLRRHLWRQWPQVQLLRGQ